MFDRCSRDVRETFERCSIDLMFDVSGGGRVCFLRKAIGFLYKIGPHTNGMTQVDLEFMGLEPMDADPMDLGPTDLGPMGLDFIGWGPMDVDPTDGPAFET